MWWSYHISGNPYLCHKSYFSHNVFVLSTFSKVIIGIGGDQLHVDIHEMLHYHLVHTCWLSSNETFHHKLNMPPPHIWQPICCYLDPIAPHYYTIIHYVKSNWNNDYSCVVFPFWRNLWSQFWHHEIYLKVLWVGVWA
jgi:hypothetical protein